MAQLQNEDLTDQKDADYAALKPAYKTVTLTDLDGSGFLRGRWANVVSETGKPAYSPTNAFIYNRSQDQFEQVMAYYWVTQAQLYIQRLGFGIDPTPCQRRVSGHQDQSVGSRQLVLDEPSQGRDPVRQGRCR